MPICGTVTAPQQDAIVLLDRVCQPHIYTPHRYLYIYPTQAAPMHIFEFEFNINNEASRYFVYNFFS